ncbi:serine/threonine-protein kinase [Proteus mirabilis]|uniref:serine/threonine-protein kinase n=1 Tax=Proteus TaxID=583 RepID=UPI0008F8D2FB|nr:MULTISPECIES: serine/threonine-protein kinase [Proteus]ASB03024.1 protein kinase [Proteus mirabilis]EKV9645544.1 serine/threonine protein kinase [Proteus mirabilis]ELA8985068.1 serine/threonine protein kinase [Proteus mirabilis]ELA9901752.1 serine/threonine protein kinase [Proteus mirabilis]ELA9917881.1 serine/threonine protein kinase [Proteus mirabilis]
MITPYQKADVSFRKIKKLDEQGCFSEVYLAHDENLDHELVIKEITKKPNQDKDTYFSEARLLYKNAHPNIVQVQYAAEDNEKIYIAMPYYINGTISQKMSRGNFTPREIIRYAIQFIGGLYHIHTKKLIHFDIKPNNIMISNRNEAMLADFGLSKLININSTAIPDHNYYFHTPPEYFTISKSGGFTYTFDIYQVGMTLYRMCIGAIEFENEISQFQYAEQLESAIKAGTFPSKQYPSHIPKKLISIINKCLESNPNNRFQSSLDILNALSSIKDDDGALDWRKCDNSDTTLNEWRKKIAGAILHLSYDSNTKSSICHRVYPDGRKRKEGKGTLTRCSHSKIYQILKGL